MTIYFCSLLPVVWYRVFEIIFHLFGISGGVDRIGVVIGFYLFPNLLSVIEKEECVTQLELELISSSNDL
jgi:hypothetical protein